ncbi:MAG: tetratricopeptide repeat protein [Kofleriaceae bacterium]
MMRSLAVSILLALAGTAAAAPKAPPPVTGKPTKKQLEIEKHEWMAQYYIRKGGDLAGAVKEYQTILQLDPENANASLALASLYARDKKDKLALEVLTKLVKKNPKNAEVWLTLAEMQSTAGDDKALKVSIEKVIALDPANESAYWIAFSRAQKRLHDGDATAKPEVLEAARKIKQVSRFRATPSYKLAERAVVELSGEPMELTIYDAKLAYASAFESGQMGRINQQMAVARRGFEECTRSQPKNEDCHYSLGLVYSSVKASDAYDPKKALGEYAQAPTTPLAWVEAARIYRATDKNTEARAALDKAIALDANLAVAQIELAILDKLAGKTDAAIAHLVAAMDSDPWGGSGEKALAELTKIKPTHPRVTQGMLAGKSGDVFSTDRYKAVVELIEKELGGLEKGAPEQAVLEDIVRKLAEGSGLRQEFKVNLVGTSIVNAFALADGHVYVTRGLLDEMKKKFPKKPIDANNDALAHILAHELAHVTRRHTLNTAVFQEAIKDTSRRLDPAILTHVTRTHEIDADREGIVMAFLAGYAPRGGIEFMEVMGQQMEIPKHLDHPTFEERVEYLTEYWTNDVRYAFVSFKLGVGAMDRGAKAEATDMTQAVAAYEEAVDHFKRFRTMLPSLKEAMNDLGIAYTKIGVLAMNKTDTPLGRWQTRFSLERESAVKYVGLVKDEESRQTRGTEKARLPWQLREGIAAFKEAIATDEGYTKARLNLATAYVAANQLDNAKDALAKLEPKRGVVAGDIELVRGIVEAETKQYDKAKGSFEKAVSSQAAKRAASYNLAKALELAGKKDDAKRAYQQYVKLFPGGPWAKAAEAAAAKL